MKLLVGVTLFFVVCIELFAVAVAARVPYVGVAFFIWVGIFNVSLVAQFWSFANDIYSKDAGERLFPIIVIGMTAGAPLGSFVAGRLFRLGVIAQRDPPDLGGAAGRQRRWSTCGSTAATKRAPARRSRRCRPADGFKLVLANPYLQARSRC